MSEKPKVEKILAAIEQGRNFAESWVLRPGTGLSTPWPRIAADDLFVLVACIREMQEEIKQDREIMQAAFDAILGRKLGTASLTLAAHMMKHRLKDDGVGQEDEQGIAQET